MRTRYDQRPMGNATSRFRRWVFAALAGVVILVVVLVAIVLAVFRFGALPLEDGTILGGGRVEAVVEELGPIAIGSFLIALENGGYALVDAGMDSEARAIRSVLRRRGATAQDVKFIFVTHAHGDHMGGIQSFPAAEVYAIEADAKAIRRTGSRTVQGLADGDVVKASGTEVEVFALPGHTPGSAAYLVYGVLFLGDSAAAAYDGVGPGKSALLGGFRSERGVACRLGATPEGQSGRCPANCIRPSRARRRSRAFSQVGIRSRVAVGIGIASSDRTSPCQRHQLTRSLFLKVTISWLPFLSRRPRWPYIFPSCERKLLAATAVTDVVGTPGEAIRVPEDKLRKDPFCSIPTTFWCFS